MPSRPFELVSPKVSFKAFCLTALTIATSTPT